VLERQLQDLAHKDASESKPTPRKSIKKLNP
jgi:hypothetical protein